MVKWDGKDVVWLGCSGHGSAPKIEEWQFMEGACPGFLVDEEKLLVTVTDYDEDSMGRQISMEVGVSFSDMIDDFLLFLSDPQIESASKYYEILKRDMREAMSKVENFVVRQEPLDSA